MKKSHFTLPLLLFFHAFAFAQKPEPAVPVGHSGAVYALAFSPDGKHAVSGSEDKSLKIWELSSGKLLKTWQPYRNEAGLAPIFGAEFALDGKYIFCGAGQIGEPLQALEFGRQDTGPDVAPGRIFLDPSIVPIGEQPSVRAMCVSPDGSEVLALTAKNDLKLWNPNNGKLKQTFVRGQEQIASICFSPDGNWVFSGNKDGSVTRWNAKTGKAASLFPNMHEGEVNAISVSPDGNSVLSGAGNSSLKWWRPGTGTATLLHEFALPYSPGQTAAFSPDGKLIAYACADQTIVFWDTLAKRPVDTLAGHAKHVTVLRFSPDGKFLLSGSFDKSLILWKVETGASALVLNGYSKILKQVFFSPNKKFACVVPEFSKEMVVWDTETGGVRNVLEGHENDVITACISPKGKYLLSSGDDRKLILREFETGNILGRLEGHKDFVKALAISPDEKHALSGSDDNSLILWDLDTRKPLKIFTEHTAKVTSVAFSPDGKFATSGADDNTVKIWDIARRSLAANIPGQASRWSPVAFSPDGKFFLSISCETSQIELWDIAKKAVLKRFSLKYDSDSPESKIYCGTPTTAAFSPDGQRFLFSSGNDVLLWNLEEPEPRSLDGHVSPIPNSEFRIPHSPRFLRGHVGFVKSVAFSPDGKIAVSAGYDGSVKLWNGRSGEALCTVFHLNTKDWVAMTPAGLFDASPGAMKSMYFVLGLEIIELEQLKDRYYEPDLLPMLMGFKKGTLRNVEALDELALYPELEAKLKNNKLVIDLKKRSGGFGKVSVFINGTEVLEDACQGKGGCTVDLSAFKSHFFSAENERAKNTISISAFNVEGWLKSPPLVLHLFSKSSRGEAGGEDSDDLDLSFGPAPDPRLYAIVVGTSDYSGSDIDLGFPDKDAGAMAEVFQTIAAGTEMFKEEVHVTLLTTASEDASLQPGKANIKAAFQKVAAESHAEDVLLIFLAGHGVTWSGEGKNDFFYLTKDVGSMKLDAAEVRNNFCISTDTLSAWISTIPAKKRVVILDACHSGKAAQSLVASRTVTSSQKRELERLKDRTGMFVLAASESNQKSWEDEQLQQGLLTYSLLFGLNSRKGVKPNGAVDVLDLFQFARDYVPQLASGIHEDQTPVLTVPDKEASSFSIGWVSGDTKIEMGPKNQFIVQSMFLNSATFDDGLQLSNAVDERLAEGALGKIIFANTRQMNGAHAIRGLYSVRDGKVRLEGRVFVPEGGAKEFLIEGFAAGDVRGLVDKIIEEVKEKLE